MIDFRITPELLTGCDDRAMVAVLGPPVHNAIVAPFQALRADAANAGFDLQIVSGFRSFDRQCRIWNAKARGERTLLDSEGCPVRFADLDSDALIDCIMRWSALPGASRHHWGSDIDVYDAAAVPADYQVQLTPEEVAPDGPFGALHRWLDDQLAHGAGYGFFRPYACDFGGIAPERWHLSYAPLAARCQAMHDEGLLRTLLRQRDVELKEVVLARLYELYQRYVIVPESAYPSAYVPLLSEGVGL
ncbi:MAG: M15 family metallopeptidase [Spongiibacter sp.]|uniref:M15 family metallopeptidase n=1 Tax=Spongiibacter thalassae TaxID=2721624 RepID=UPI001B2FEDAB|nr:M15 family metallopeptidase [Spongiibacter thalassae]MDX1505986.1 M15 family metallopeptidase [Spongiibacter sp.]